MTYKQFKLRGAATTALLIALSASYANAQDAQDDDAIVVTGTYVKGTPTDGALPIDVYTSEDLIKSGVSSPLEFIKSLPSVGGVLGDSNVYAAGTEHGVGSINLRELGRERTLVLFNGRRAIPRPGAGAADTQLIPMFALGQIEILNDGAAATYGSDAIAGVANFITKKNFEGVEVAANYTFVDGSDNDYQLSALIGENFEKGNIMIGVGYQHRSELSNTERDFTQVSYAENPAGYSPYSNPSTYLPLAGGTPVAGLTLDGAEVGTCQALGGTERFAFNAFDVCNFTYVPFTNLVEDQERFQIYGQADYDFSNDLSFHGEALYSHVALDSIAASPSYPPQRGPNGPATTAQFVVPGSNPGFADFVSQTFAPGSLPTVAANAAVIFFGRPFAFGGNPLDPEAGAGRGSAVSEAFRLTGGFEKTFSDNFEGQLYATYLENDRSAFSPDIIGSRYQAALNGFGGDDCTGTVAGANGCLFFNPFANAVQTSAITGGTNPAYVAGNENSVDVVDWFSAPYGARNKEDQLVLDLVFNGNTKLSFANDMAFGYAFGAQYRKSNFSISPIGRFSDPDQVPCAIEGDTSCQDDPADANQELGPFIFFGQFGAANYKQDVWAAFAEGNLTVTDNFDVTLATRYESYGGNVGSTFNPKLSARWQATPSIAFRGSIGSTFRGPLAGDLSDGTALAVAPFESVGGTYKATREGGNADLAPETALASNLGVIFNKNGFKFSADYWRYDFEGRFADLPYVAIANAVSGGAGDGTQLADCSSAFVDFVDFSGGCTQGVTTAADVLTVNTKTVNGPDVLTSGIDFSAGYKFDLGSADMSIGGSATHILKYDVGEFEYEGLQFDDGYDAVGFTNYSRSTGTVSDWRTNAYVRAEVNDVLFGYSMRYIAGVDDNRCPDSGPCATTELGPTDFGRRVKGFVQHDLSVAYTLDIAGSETNLRLGVENVFNKDPSAARLQQGYDPYYGNPVGRVFKVSARSKF